MLKFKHTGYDSILGLCFILSESVLSQKKATESKVVEAIKTRSDMPRRGRVGQNRWGRRGKPQRDERTLLISSLGPLSICAFLHAEMSRMCMCILGHRGIPRFGAWVPLLHGSTFCSMHWTVHMKNRPYCQHEKQALLSLQWLFYI